jgi:O-antigen/teichoic acid export membrane protein
LDHSLTQEKKLSTKQNIIFNSAGSIFYLFCQWVITVLVVRMSGYDDAGIWSLAIATTNVFYVIASYSVKTYQVSDLQSKYRTGVYVSSRILSCSTAVLLCAGYVLLNPYSFKQTSCIIIYMLFRSGEAFVDVFQGVQQKAWRMDIIGISYAIRGLLSLIAFIVAFQLLHSLFFAIVAMVVATYSVIALFDVLQAEHFDRISPLFCKREIAHLLIECFPLTSNAFMMNLLALVPLYFLEQIYSSKILGIYSSVATPTVIVQAASNFIVSPLITLFAEYYKDKQKKPFIQLINRCLLAIGILTVIAVLGALLMGKWVLCLLYGESIIPYAYLLIPIIITTVLTAIMWLSVSLLIVVRRFRGMISGSAMGLVTALAVSFFLVRAMQLDGVVLATVLALAIQILVNSVFLMKEVNRHFAD